MKKTLSTLAVVLLALLMLVSCGKKDDAKTTTTTTTTTTVASEPAKADPAPAAVEEPAAAPADDKVVFRIANGAEPESLDPAKIQGVPEHRIFETLFEGLIIYDPQTADGIPGLAESWEVSEDGMTYTFKKALGGNIGKSICENDKLDLALSLLQEAKDKGVNLVLAVDAVVADDFSNDANTLVVDPMDIPEAYEGMDIGPKTRELFGEVIKNSKTILWNGPCGVFEFDNFSNGSRAIAEAIVEATKNGAFSLIGGGDSVACVNKFNLADQVSYVSTGGGALLEAIEGKELPGIAAIK